MVALFIGGTTLVVGAIGHQVWVQVTRRSPSLDSATNEAMKCELEIVQDELLNHHICCDRDNTLGEPRNCKFRILPFPLPCICDRSVLVTTKFAP